MSLTAASGACQQDPVDNNPVEAHDAPGTECLPSTSGDEPDGAGADRGRGITFMRSLQGGERRRE
jgi:hypothetical protein